MLLINKLENVIKKCKYTEKRVYRALKHEVRNYQFTKSSCKSELRKMMSHFKLLTRRFL